MSHRRLIESVVLNSFHPKTYPQQTALTSERCGWELLIYHMCIEKRTERRIPCKKE